jgi:hypothetical protein
MQETINSITDNNCFSIQQREGMIIHENTRILLTRIKQMCRDEKYAHLSNTGGSYRISSVIGGIRDSGTHSSHSSSISYKKHTLFSNIMLAQLHTSEWILKTINLYIQQAKPVKSTISSGKQYDVTINLRISLKEK